jgi:hypothetical protein
MKKLLLSATIGLFLGSTPSYAEGVGLICSCRATTVTTSNGKTVTSKVTLSDTPVYIDISSKAISFEAETPHKLTQVTPLAVKWKYNDSDDSVEGYFDRVQLNGWEMRKYGSTPGLDYHLATMYNYGPCRIAEPRI